MKPTPVIADPLVVRVTKVTLLLGGSSGTFGSGSGGDAAAPIISTAATIPKKKTYDLRLRRQRFTGHIVRSTYDTELWCERAPAPTEGTGVRRAALLDEDGHKRCDRANETGRGQEDALASGDVSQDDLMPILHLVV